MTRGVGFSLVPTVPGLVQLLSLGTVPLLSELGDIKTFSLCQVIFRRVLFFVVAKRVVIGIIIKVVTVRLRLTARGVIGLIELGTVMHGEREFRREEHSKRE